MESRRLLFGWSLVLLTLPSEARCDQWSVNETVLPANAEEVALSQDVVRKWCENGGSKVRFSNTSVIGYHECGELAVAAQCDAGGKKFFSATASAPYAYRDCASGPRIYIKRHDEPIEGAYDYPIATVPAPEAPSEVLGRDLSSRGGGAGGGLTMSKETAAQISGLNESDLAELMRAVQSNPELRDALQNLLGARRR